MDGLPFNKKVYNEGLHIAINILFIEVIFLGKNVLNNSVNIVYFKYNVAIFNGNVMEVLTE